MVKAKKSGRGGKRAGAGRPPIDNPRTERLEVRLTVEEHANALKAAGDENLSDFTRDFLMRAVKRRLSA
jgi:hypothetical protein